MKITVKPISSGLGAEIYGLDFSVPQSSDTVTYINELLYEYHLLYFGRQDLSKDQLTIFSRYFGASNESFPLYKPDENHRNISLVEDSLRLTADSVTWHRDDDLAVILHAQMVPVKGGDTMWSNSEAVYDSLSQKMKDYLEGLEVESEGGYSLLRGLQRGYIKKDHPIFKSGYNVDMAPTVYPATRIHPITKKKVFGFPISPLVYMKGIPENESSMIMRLLYDYMREPQFIYRHRWREGDLIVWDDISTMHTAIYDFSEKRVLYRAGVSHVPG